MIARIWHGRVPIEKAEEYIELMRSRAIPDYKKVPGNAGAFVLHRNDGEVTHVVMLSFWVNLEAIAGFAGDDLSAAQYYDFDKNYLLEFEPNVKHYEAEGS